MRPARVDLALVPSALLLLPEYAGLQDPVPELRAASREVTAALVASHPGGVGVLAAPARPADRARGVGEAAGARIARRLLADAGFAGDPGGPTDLDGLLVVASGSARRAEHSPATLDERALAFDDRIEAALRDGDLARLRGVDEQLGEELLCPDAGALWALGELAGAAPSLDGELVRAEDPFGVRYWVGWWTCGS